MSKSINSQSHWNLFLLFPIYAAYYALKSYKATWAKNIIWAFVVFYGFTIGTSKEIAAGSDGGTADIFRYAQGVKDLHEKSLSFSEIKKLYAENEDIDILNLTISIIVSRITDNLQLLAAVYGLIFGFFFSRNIWFVLERVKGEIKPIILILIAAYFLVNPFWNIGGFRFWTATHIFIYGLLPYLYKGQKKGIFISSLSVLVHFSFTLPVLFLWLYVLIGNRTVFYFVFFISSIITSEFNITTFNAFIEANAPEKVVTRTSGYRNEESVEEFREGGENAQIDNTVQISWHARFYQKALKWSLMAFLIFLFFRRKVIKQFSASIYNSFNFTLLFWGFANIMSSIPSGGRYLTVAALSALPLIIFFLHNRKKEKMLSNLIVVAYPALLLFIIVSIRVGFYSITLKTLLNPIIVLFMDNNVTLNDLIK